LSADYLSCWAIREKGLDVVVESVNGEEEIMFRDEFDLSAVLRRISERH
jgi:hypothetical protein